MGYAVEKWKDVSKEIMALSSEHYEEIAHYKDIALEPDEERYNQIEEGGMLRVFTLRNIDKKLIGYALFFVNKNLHYKSSKQAVQDVIFIRKENRGRGGRFIAWCDEQLKAEKVQVVYHHVKTKHDFGVLLERQGYECVDKIYGKRLDKEVG